MIPEIIAHRGASFDAPENTPSALQLAWQQGADAAEGDFQLTRDGQLVCLHDANLLRTAGVNLQAKDATLAELRQYDFGAWKGPGWTGERIATLAEMLELVPAGKRYFIEMKGATGAVSELSRVIRAASLSVDQIVIISLDRHVCMGAKQALPSHQIYWVVDFQYDAMTELWTPTIDEMLSVAAQEHFDGLDVSSNGPIDDELGQRIRAAGLGLCTWTVNEPVLARRLLAAGVQGLTTDRPGWLRAELHSLG